MNDAKTNNNAVLDAYLIAHGMALQNLGNKIKETDGEFMKGVLIRQRAIKFANYKETWMERFSKELEEEYFVDSNLLDDEAGDFLQDDAFIDYCEDKFEDANEALFNKETA